MRKREGEERGDQKMARSCHVEALRSYGVGGQVLPIEDIDIWENEECGKLAEDLVPIPLVPGDKEKFNYIGASF